MSKLVFNYTNKSNEHKRLVLDKTLPYCREVLCAMLFLQTVRLISLENVLNITEQVEEYRA